MPNGIHYPDDANPEDEIRRLFPHGLLVDALQDQGYTDVEVERVDRNLYSASMRSGNEPIVPTVAEQQLAEIVQQVTDAQWQIESIRTIVTGRRITVEIRVSRVLMA